MEMISVDSSNIAEIGWEAGSKSSVGILNVRFSNGSLYEYYDVESVIFDLFIKAESKGKFFSSFIRKIYKYSKIEG